MEFGNFKPGAVEGLVVEGGGGDVEVFRGLIFGDDVEVGGGEVVGGFFKDGATDEDDWLAGDGEDAGGVPDEP